MAKRNVHVRRHGRRQYTKRDGTHVSAAVVSDYDKRIDALNKKLEIEKRESEISKAQSEALIKRYQADEMKAKAELERIEGIKAGSEADNLVKRMRLEDAKARLDRLRELRVSQKLKAERQRTQIDAIMEVSKPLGGCSGKRGSLLSPLMSVT